MLYEVITPVSHELQKITLTGKGSAGNSYNETESILAQLWAKALGVSEIDVYETFHEMGGDSIMVV